MNNFREELGKMRVRAFVNYGEKGRLYILDKTESSVYFIIDIKDGCIYLNQNIYSLVMLENLKMPFPNFAIFPYDDSFSAEEISNLDKSGDINHFLRNFNIIDISKYLYLETDGVYRYLAFDELDLVSTIDSDLKKELYD